MISRFPIPLAIASMLCAGPALAQSPLEKARQDLQQAVTELTDTQREYGGQRRALYRDINRLDDEALELNRELRKLISEEERRTGRIKSLEREVAGRRTVFDYSSGILNQYSKALVTRLHPAENQLYREQVEGIDQKAVSAAEDPVAEIAERAKVLRIGLDRLGMVAGGHAFEGKALRNGSESVEGKFLLLGPSVFFASQAGDFEGVATFAEAGTMLPTVVGVQDSEGMIAKAVRSGQGELPFDGSMGKALEVAAAQESLLDVIEKGGIVGHAILTLGAVSLLIAAFKFWQISRISVPSGKKLNKILDDLIRGDQAAAAAKAAQIKGMAGQLVQTGVEMFYDKRRVLEEALFERLVTVRPRLEKFLPFLGLTAAAAPLMGLLGTVLGIIKTFKAMALYGTGNAKSFSAGISEALITTAEGLVVAIPVLVIHGLLKSYAKGRFSEFEAIGISIINGTTELGGQTPKPTEDEHGDDDIELAPTTA